MLPGLFTALTISATLLGHDNYCVRQNAHARLAAFHHLAVPALESVLEASGDAETWCRIELLLEQFDTRRNEEERLSRRFAAKSLAMTLLADYPDGVYVDATPDDYPLRHRYNYYLQLAQTFGIPSRVESGPILWPAYAAATRLWLIDELMDGMGEESAKEMLAVMASRSRWWDKHNSYFGWKP